MPGVALVAVQPRTVYFVNTSREKTFIRSLDTRTRQVKRLVGLNDCPGLTGAKYWSMVQFTEKKLFLTGGDVDAYMCTEITFKTTPG